MTIATSIAIAAQAAGILQTIVNLSSQAGVSAKAEDLASKITDKISDDIDSWADQVSSLESESDEILSRNEAYGETAANSIRRPNDEVLG